MLTAAHNLISVFPMTHGIHMELSVRYSAKKMKFSALELQVHQIAAFHLILRPPVPRFVHLRATQKIKSIAQDMLTLKLVANMKVGANRLSAPLFVKIPVQSNVLQENGHASWDTMTMVVLCERPAPLMVYALKFRPCKDGEKLPHHKNDPKIMITYYLVLYFYYQLSSFLIL